MHGETIKLVCRLVYIFVFTRGCDRFLSEFT